jgi:hypothetical protein
MGKTEIGIVSIPRGQWARGGDIERPMRSKTGQMTVLGFVCRAFGVKPTVMVDVRFPSELPEEIRANLPRWLRSTTNGGQAQWLARLNDHGSNPPARREKAIARMLGLHKIQVTFVG